MTAHPPVPAIRGPEFALPGSVSPLPHRRIGGGELCANGTRAVARQSIATESPSPNVVELTRLPGLA